jgi:hypothetical protein
MNGNWLENIGVERETNLHVASFCTNRTDESVRSDALLLTSGASTPARIYT